MRTFFLEYKIFFEHSLPLKSTNKWPKFYHQIATRPYTRKPETSLQQITAELLFPYSFSLRGRRWKGKGKGEFGRARESRLSTPATQATTALVGWVLSSSLYLVPRFFTVYTLMASELELFKSETSWMTTCERHEKNYLSFLERFVFESLSLSFDVHFLRLCLCFFFLFFSRFDFLLFCLFLLSSPSLVSTLLSCESLSLVVDSSSNAFSCSILQELEKTFN